MSSNKRGELEKTLGTKDIIALAFGTMIGWGWIMLAGTWVATGGSIGAIIAFGIGAILCVFVGLTYAELTPALPLAGGELVFSYRSMGYNGSWLCGWMITFAYIGVACWEGPAFVTAIEFLLGDAASFFQTGYLWSIAGFDVYLVWALFGGIVSIILSILNFRGVKQVAIFQACATIGLAIGGVCFLVSALVNGNSEWMFPAITSSAGISAVILAVPAMFVGFDVIPQAAEEMNFPLKKIPRVLIISICLAAFWYMFMILAISLSAPPDFRAESAINGIPVADSFSYAMGGPIFGKFMIVAAICGILSSWNGFIIGATRVLFSMGRAKMIPGVFAKLHPTHNTPVAAIVLVGVLTAVSPLLGKQSLGWFVDASAFGTVIAYFMVVLSFIILRKKEPNLARPFVAPGGMLFGVIALLVSIFFISLYTPLSPSGGLAIECWYMVLGWLILGIVFYIIVAIQNKSVTPAERDYLLFGDKYTRFPGEGGAKPRD